MTTELDAARLVATILETTRGDHGQEARDALTAVILECVWVAANDFFKEHGGAGGVIDALTKAYAADQEATVALETVRRVARDWLIAGDKVTP